MSKIRSSGLKSDSLLVTQVKYQCSVSLTFSAVCFHCFVKGQSKCAANVCISIAHLLQYKMRVRSLVLISSERNVFFD